jgi:Putative auto-transporter adhesin, head GIN domain
MDKLISEERQVSGFDRFAFEGAGEIFLEQGQVEALTLEGDADVLARIKSEVSDGRLVIKPKSWLDFLWFRQRIKVHLVMKEIHEIKISGSANLQGSSLITSRLALEVSGSADVDVDRLETENLDVNISGTGQFEAAGRATRQHLHISGSGKYEAWGLDSQDAEISVSGSGRITLKVQNSLNVRVSGSAEVRYLGNPQISQHISGSANVRRMESK